MFHLRASFCQKIAVAKNAEAAENGRIFQCEHFFQHSDTHSRAAHAAHQAVTIKVGVCCVHVCNFNI
jgi:hypothetical protein